MKVTNLPTELVLSTKQLEGWNNASFEEREELIGHYLSDTYGFLHNGYRYKVVDDKIYLTDIDWEIDEEDADHYEDVLEENK